VGKLGLIPRAAVYLIGIFWRTLSSHFPQGAYASFDPHVRDYGPSIHPTSPLCPSNAVFMARAWPTLSGNWCIALDRISNQTLHSPVAATFLCAGIASLQGFAPGCGCLHAPKMLPDSPCLAHFLAHFLVVSPLMTSTKQKTASISISSSSGINSSISDGMGRHKIPDPCSIPRNVLTYQVAQIIIKQPSTYSTCSLEHIWNILYASSRTLTSGYSPTIHYPPAFREPETFSQSSQVPDDIPAPKNPSA
jgi:hypothetical protein